MEYIQANQWAQNGVASVVLVIAVFVLRWILLRHLARAAIRSVELRRRWSAQIRNVCWLILLFGLVLIWATELRTLAISVVAALAAIVLAAKELILCATGSVFKTTAKSFVVGDQIEVANFRGMVIDQTLLSTTLVETGPGQTTHQHTGRSIVLPNSLFLSMPLINESFTGKYVLHVFRTPVKADEWRRAEDNLLQAAREICAPYLEEARREIAQSASQKHLDMPTVEPRVVLSTPEPGRVDLVLRIPAPADRKGRIEQDVLRRFLLSQTQ